MAQIRINNQYSSLKKVLDEGKKLEIKDVLEGVEEKDMLSLSVVGEAIQYIAYALDMIISVINPEKIILYGEFFQNKYIFKSLLNEIGKITLDEQNYQIKRSKFYEKIYEIAPLALGNYLIFKK